VVSRTYSFFLFVCDFLVAEIMQVPTSFPTRNAQGELPGQYKNGKCVKKWGLEHMGLERCVIGDCTDLLRGPVDASTRFTVLDLTSNTTTRYHKKLNIIERRGTMEVQSNSSKNQMQACTPCLMLRPPVTHLQLRSLFNRNLNLNH
jgi:hypothetical protein